MEQDARPLMRVVVPFGRKKLYAGLIAKVHSTPPAQYQAKYIEQVLDETPIINEVNYKLWQWISDYYMCPMGSVMNVALPAGFKISSETKITRHPELDEIKGKVNDKEYLILEALESQTHLSLEEIADLLQQKTILPTVNAMINKRMLITEEDMKLRFKPKMVPYVRLVESYRNEKKLNEILNALSSAPKQMEALMQYLKISGWHTENKVEVRKQILNEAMQKSASSIKALVDKGVFEIYEREEGRLNPFVLDTELKLKLTEQQTIAIEKIQGFWKEKKPVLLHGVTSSGKTEVYIQLIKDCIQQGKQALFLVPEIALTTQLVNRLKAHFGDQMGVYHSRFNDNERVETWNAILGIHKYSKFKLIVGARSSLFLPFDKLGLIIVDEEQENSFKQFDPEPRYHARDVAIVAATISKANIVMGTATPSYESYDNALKEKYGLVEMKQRFGNREMPKIEIADLKKANAEKAMHGSFSPELYQEIKQALERKEQIILFRNRRGFAPRAQCTTCGWTTDCKNCDISLTYHKFRKEMVCHYCGFSVPFPKTCGQCGSPTVNLQGQGTEKIEEEISELFPHARVARMDLETTRQKHSYQKLISDFEDRQIDVLVGTQMLSKGLDFDNVSLVGIISADSILHYPDFRAYEKAFSLMEQVAGRAGRKNKKGRVIIQSFDNENPILNKVQNHDYQGTYIEQLKHRKEFFYPPYSRLIQITLKHKDPQFLRIAAEHFGKYLKPTFKANMLGPEPPTIARIRNWYIEHMLLKIPANQTNKTLKRMILDAINHFKSQKEFNGVRIILDVDPQ
tara:strand:- start:79046 stop:81442 length:2397 start_codon:yes stop_codon:yes gene_type:complete